MVYPCATPILAYSPKYEILEKPRIRGGSIGQAKKVFPEDFC